MRGGVELRLVDTGGTVELHEGRGTRLADRIETVRGMEVGQRLLQVAARTMKVQVTSPHR